MTTTIPITTDYLQATTTQLRHLRCEKEGITQYHDTRLQLLGKTVFRHIHNEGGIGCHNPLLLALIATDQVEHQFTSFFCSKIIITNLAIFLSKEPISVIEMVGSIFSFLLVLLLTLSVIAVISEFFFLLSFVHIIFIVHLFIIYFRITEKWITTRYNLARAMGDAIEDLFGLHICIGLEIAEAESGRKEREILCSGKDSS